MARRPKARLITGHFDLHDVSFRTKIRSPKPAKRKRKRVRTKASALRGLILRSKRIWQKGEQGHTLRPEARSCLGHNIQLCQTTAEGKQLWKWSISSIMCLGVSNSFEEARVDALEEVLRWLGSPQNRTVMQELTKLVKKIVR
jgi:hypothetical protein